MVCRYAELVVETFNLTNYLCCLIIIINDNEVYYLNQVPMEHIMSYVQSVIIIKNVKIMNLKRGVGIDYYHKK